MNTLQKCLLGVAVLAGFAGQAWAEVLPADATNVRSIKIFRNVSGATQVSGTAYVLQDNSTDANVLVAQTFGNEGSLGLDVTTTTTDDVNTFVGCQLDDTVVDDGLVRVVTWGPAICKWAGSSDNTNTRMATVGTSSVAGNLGSGTNAGLTMSLTLAQPGYGADTVGTTAGEQNGQANNEMRWIWVAPANSD